MYQSYLGIAVDYDNINGVMGAGDYVPQYGNIGGDPINLINGNFIWQYTDIECFGAEPLSWQRTYNSLDVKNNGVLGHKWRHSYQFEVVERPLTAQVFFPDGAALTYNKNYYGGYQKPIGTDYELSKTSSGFELSGRDKTLYVFDDEGRIRSYTNADGLITNYFYSYGKLFAITNNSGSLIFSYNGEKIDSVTDGSGKTVTYLYNNDDLVTVTNPDGSTLAYTYNNDHDLLTIKDFNGNIYLTNVFDDKHRVISQTITGQGTSHIAYDPRNRKTTFTDARGLVTVYHYNEYQMLTSTEDIESGIVNTPIARSS
jgi:YD repeat-containing protein